VTDLTPGWAILHGMSQEAVEFIRRRVEEFLRSGDFDPADFDNGFEFDNSNAKFDGAIYRGPEGLREYLSLMRQMWEQFHFEAQEYVAVGEDKVVVPYRITVVGRDGIETVAHSAVVYTLHGRKLAHAKAFQSKADALAAAG